MYKIKTLPEFDRWLNGIKDRMTRLRSHGGSIKQQEATSATLSHSAKGFTRCMNILDLAGACIMSNAGMF